MHKNQNLFTHLKIWKCSPEILEKQGKYPVIYLSFKDTKGRKWEDKFGFTGDEVRTLLLFSGYLTIGKKSGTFHYEVKIPNYEVKIVFQTILLDWFEEELKVIKSLLETTANSLVNNDLSRFREGFQKIMGDTFSYYDTVGEAERVYQAYVLGMLAILSDEYVLRSNRESGEGRYDIVLIPRDKSKMGMVMEIKQLGKKPDESDSKLKSRVERSLNTARKQMEKNRYSQELMYYGVMKILLVPIVFFGKQAYL